MTVLILFKFLFQQCKYKLKSSKCESCLLIIDFDPHAGQDEPHVWEITKPGIILLWGLSKKKLFSSSVYFFPSEVSGIAVHVFCSEMCPFLTSFFKKKHK